MGIRCFGARHPSRGLKQAAKNKPTRILKTRLKPWTDTGGFPPPPMPMLHHAPLFLLRGHTESTARCMQPTKVCPEAHTVVIIIIITTTTRATRSRCYSWRSRLMWCVCLCLDSRRLGQPNTSLCNGLHTRSPILLPIIYLCLFS